MKTVDTLLLIVLVLLLINLRVMLMGRKGRAEGKDSLPDEEVEPMNVASEGEWGEEGEKPEEEES